MILKYTCALTHLYLSHLLHPISLHPNTHESAKFIGDNFMRSRSADGYRFCEDCSRNVLFS